MGTIARYLIPIDSKISAADYGAKAKAVLLEMEVISESEDAADGLYYNGEKSTEPFQTESDDEECGFESAQIFSSPRFVLAPDEYVDGASCPKCNADITEQWMSEVRDDDGKPIEHDSPDVRISCPHCGAVWRLDQVKSESVDKFYMTDRFVCFWDAWPFKPEWVAKFALRMGCHHDVFEYYWT